MPNDPLEQEIEANQNAAPPNDMGEEFIDVVEPTDQWSEWRTALATQMFNDWQANRGHGN